MAEISSLGKARTLRPQELQERALWHRGEAFSSHHHPQPCEALNYKLPLSIKAIRAETEELLIPPCVYGLCPQASSGEHSDLLHHHQQDQGFTQGF